MTLEELNQEWKRNLVQVDSRTPVSLRPQAAALLARVERSRHALTGLDWYEWITGTLALLLLSAFLWAHGADLRLALLALLMMGWCVVFLVLNVQRRRERQGLDWALPVVPAQVQFAQLRAQRLSLFKWALLIGQVVWYIPFVVVTVKALTGVNLLDSQPGFVWSNLLIGCALVPALLWVCRTAWFGHWVGGRLRPLADRVAGKDVVLLRAYVAQLQAFDQEQTAPAPCP